MIGVYLRSGIQRNVGIRRNDIRNLLRPKQYRRAILPLLELWNHAAANVANLGVVQDALKAVPHLNAALVVLNSKDHQNAFIAILGPNLPLVIKLRGEVLDGQTIKRFDRHHFDRGMGLLIDLLGQVLEALLRTLVDNTGKVADITRRLRQLIGRLRPSIPSYNRQEEKEPEELRKSATRTHGAILRLFPLKHALPHPICLPAYGITSRHWRRRPRNRHQIHYQNRYWNYSQSCCWNCFHWNRCSPNFPWSNPVTNGREDEPASRPEQPCPQ